MKKYFKYSPQSNQYYYVYRGMPINIDKEDFDLMSDEDILTYIKAKITQTPKPKQEDVLSHQEGLAEFQKTKDMLRKKMNFSNFYNSTK